MGYEAPMSTADSDAVVLINVYKCEPAKQDALMEALTVMVGRQRGLEGFVSATLHRGVNGKVCAVHGVWASREDWKAMTRHPAIVEAMSPIMGIATFEPNLYEPGETFD
ncbi:MAG TPA: antibiotic biosynthesis monooxygenase [Brevundimonas sp.]|jgi:heme-degrading monooxygenase HmoA|nr:antibiotic biosynthesis monooxygenase [Brevundimonas sp.]HAV50395.1 antibiotic biosynthesis monooxygenase [Brevundimonas sp.]|tara:strand:+ start:3010 stop:3336 length:327 start_codon:yes stop_codon:yes gene_type:complete